MNIVRFAPSPTGFLHIGGARTCLFNWLFARSTNGKFILRIEDTDQNRSEKRYLDEILDSLQWLGLGWDELYFQSQRFDIYREYANKLLASGKAFKEGEAIIYKVPENAKIRFFDVLHGEIAIDTEQIKDQVLMKSDGSPTYNFCCVIDDALMGMTHIIRGDDHIANTPKQIMLYEALGFKLPKFVHIPMILGEDRARMSKRHGATAITEYRNQGYLPEALVNYLALLGWSSGTEKEIFSLQSLVKDFSLKRINKTAAIFDMNKLNWTNGQYIKNCTLDQLLSLIRPRLEQAGYEAVDIQPERLKGIINLYKTRFSTINQFTELTYYLFSDAVRYNEEAVNKFFNETTADYLERFKNKLESVGQNDFNIKVIEDKAREIVEELGIKSGELIHPIRLALTGDTVSPGIFELIYFLGQERALRRLERIVEKIKTRSLMFDKLKEV